MQSKHVPARTKRVPFVPSSNSGHPRKVKERVTYKPEPFDVLAYAKAATAQLELSPAESPGRRGRGGKVPGKPYGLRKYPNGRKAAAASGVVP